MVNQIKKQNLKTNPLSSGPIIKSDEIRYYIRMLFAINLIFVPLSILLYGENFDMVTYPLSSLGNPVTENGYANIFGMILFDMNILFFSLICFKLSQLYKNATDEFHYRLKSFLFFSGATGLLINLAPCGYFDHIHQIGAAVFTASIWFATVLLFVESISSSRPFGFYFIQIINHLAIFSYAYMFLRKLTGYNTVQKFAFLGLLVNLYLPTLGFNNKNKSQ